MSAEENASKMETKRFKKNDDGFVCGNCGFHVQPLGYSSRNHCPKCLCSLHVDINPGDRERDCSGLMKPVAVEPNALKGFIITHKCQKCGGVSKNRSAADDDTDLLIKYTNPDNIK